MPCTCNEFTISPSGGIAVGGSATVSSPTEVVSGGLTLGGRALISTNSITDNLAHWLPGDSLIDETGNTTFSGTATLTTGLCLGSILFDGADNLVAADPPELEVEFSCSLWIYRTEYYQERPLISFGDIVFGLNALGSPYLSIVDGESCYSSDILDMEKWYHFCGTYDGNYLKIYINGELSEETELEEEYNLTFDSAIIGDRLEGKLADIRIYQSALDAEYIQALRDNICGSFYSLGSVVDPVLT